MAGGRTETCGPTQTPKRHVALENRPLKSQSRDRITLSYPIPKMPYLCGMTTHLARIGDALRERVSAAFAHNTRRSYASTLRLYERFCTENGLTPEAPLSVIAFCEHLAAQGRKMATIERHVAALRVRYRVADDHLRMYLRGLRRTLGSAQSKKSPPHPYATGPH